MSGTLFIVAAPSGAGKTSLTRALLERERDIKLSVSYTSRAPRPGEQDGVHYHFVSRPVFELMIECGEFFEHAVVHGDLKGTARKPVFDALAQGRDVLLEIDWQGARQMREHVEGSVSVFILPPSRQELERRLRSRASDSEAVIARRLVDSRQDISHAVEFDFIVVNDRFEDALNDLLAIVGAQRLRSICQAKRNATLLDDLLRPAD
jgi:guanylate kinase